ncbi:MAG: magnesium/cobalt transporter CorA [Candidatus Hydrogenedentes bacterium]|nr:magnesium/cobalt transporter CorA [Candidatus Hydrogenedentota bacterium]
MHGSHRRHRGRTKREYRAKPGTVPGAITVDPNAARPLIRVFGFGPTAYTEQEVTDLGCLEQFLETWPVTWVNVDGLGDAEVIHRIGAIFDLHGLALEDVTGVHQRPKVEHYDNNIFIVARMLQPGNRFDTEQLSIFLGHRFVLTFQETPGDCLDFIRDRIRKGLGRVRACGSDYLAYAILDAVVDAYFPPLEAFGEELEVLEDEILLKPTKQSVARVHVLKRNTLAIRRAIWPLREAVNGMLRDATPLISDDTRVYLRDCYDHTVQIIDFLENHREIASGLMDIYLSSTGNRLNEIMKVLTIISTIFIPLTFIAGVYGMNFHTDISPWNMPELTWYWGYPFFWLFNTAIAAAMLYYFWRLGWILTSWTRPPEDPRRHSNENKDNP